MYGEYTEVVLHSLDTNSACIVKIANGHVTGRQLGAPITNLALLKLKKGKDVSEPYMTKSPTGKMLRSTTTIVRNPSGNPIGLLCINFDINAPMQSFLKNMFFPGSFPSDLHLSPEIFAQNMDETIESTIETVKNDVWNEKTISPSKRNREIVIKLHELGIFKYKESILLVACVLEISKDTIYLYLREMEKKYLERNL